MYVEFKVRQVLHNSETRRSESPSRLAFRSLQSPCHHKILTAAVAHLTAPGPYVLGVGEAGMGPVLDPMVYGVAFCPEAQKSDLDGLEFAGALYSLTRL